MIKITRISGNENAVDFSFIYLGTEFIWGYLLYSCFTYLSWKHSEKIIYSYYSWVKVESVHLKLYGNIKSSLLQDKEYTSKCKHCLDIKNTFFWTMACHSFFLQQYCSRGNRQHIIFVILGGKQIISYMNMFKKWRNFRNIASIQQFSADLPPHTGVPQEFLKHAIPDYLVRSNDLFSLTLSNKKNYSQHNNRHLELKNDNSQHNNSRPV